MLNRKKCHKSLPSLVVNLAHVRNNYTALLELSGKTIVGAVLKCNAYGFGANRIAHTLYEAGCRHFFIANYEENKQLSLIKNLPDTHIYLLNGAENAEQKKIWKQNLIPVLFRADQVENWLKLGAALGMHKRCVLQIDTGLHRLGLSEAEAIHYGGNSQLNLVCLLQHFATAYSNNVPAMQLQIHNTKNIRDRIKQLTNKSIPCSLFSSCGYFADPVVLQGFGDNTPQTTNLEYMSRVGRLLYGSLERIPADHPIAKKIKFIATLQAPIRCIQNVKHGDGIGYNYLYRAQGDRKIATVNIGYGHGYAQVLAGKAHGILHGTTKKYSVPVIGVIAMEFLMIDVTDVPSNEYGISTQIEFLG